MLQISSITFAVFFFSAFVKYQRSTAENVFSHPFCPQLRLIQVRSHSQSGLKAETRTANGIPLVRGEPVMSFSVFCLSSWSSERTLWWSAAFCYTARPDTFFSQSQGGFPLLVPNQTPQIFSKRKCSRWRQLSNRVSLQKKSRTKTKNERKTTWNSTSSVDEEFC